jgi:hypothetical protein
VRRSISLLLNGVEFVAELTDDLLGDAEKGCTERFDAGQGPEDPDHREWCEPGRQVPRKR